MEVQVIKRRLRPEQQSRRKEIIACTQALISKHGAAISMETVAAKANTSRSTLYRHFSSREHLIAEATLDAGHRLIQRLSKRKMPGSSVGENVAWLCDRLTTTAEANNTFLAVCIANLSAEDPAVIDAQDEIENLMSGLLGVATGNLEYPNRKQAEQTLFRYLLGCFVLATSGKMTYQAVADDLQNLCEQLLEMVWDKPPAG